MIDVKKVRKLLDRDVEAVLNIGNNRHITVHGKFCETTKPFPLYNIGTGIVFENGKTVHNGVGISFAENNIVSIIPMEESTLITDILDGLNCGTIKARWEGWNFGGGHTDGDYDRYILLIDDNEIGEIQYNLTNGVTVYSKGQCILMDSEDETFSERVFELLMDSVKTDKELMDKLGKDEDGNPDLPRDYEDISRKDILADNWIKGD